jgi:thioredoxin 2
MIITCPKCGVKNRIDSRADALTAVCGRCGTALPVSSAKPDKPLVVTDESFADEVLGASVPVLLDCWAPWCGPCRMLTPTLEALATESAGKFRVAKLNVDENPGTAARFQISSIPAVLLFDQGKLVNTLVGLRPKAAYLEAVKAVAR